MIDWKVHTYAQLTSTQDYVKELAEEGLPEGIVVQALTQSKGRGRQGREWTSPMGNLYMSLLLRPACAPEKAGQVAFVTALAVAGAMKDHAPGAITLKWPNDILIDGKKAAGILIESGLKDGLADWLVVGIGVNILAPPDGAAGLSGIAIHPLRDKVLAELDGFYKQWKHQGFQPIRTQWLKQAHGLHGPIRAAGHEGVFKDMDEQGALVLTLSDGTEKSVHAGEVFFT